MKMKAAKKSEEEYNEEILNGEENMTNVVIFNVININGIIKILININEIMIMKGS